MIWPEAMLFLLLVPLTWLLLQRLDRVRRDRLKRYVGTRIGAAVGDSGGDRCRVLFSSALLLAVVAVMQPTWGTAVRHIDQLDVDVVVCLDVSRSMLARDVAPSRLAHAHTQLRELSGAVRGGRLGLVAFAGSARLRAPLTKDMQSFAQLAEQTDSLTVELGGTNLGAALEVALKALPDPGDNPAAVLLITDGEDNEQRGLAVAATCKERGITVHCAGIGSELGSKIVVRDGDRDTFLRSRGGDEVVSAMDAPGLRGIASSSRGTFIDASASEQALADLYAARILPMARKSHAERDGSERKNRFQWPLLAAFLLWLIELFLSDRRRS
ncbi:MAG: hypothetical protein CMJ85_01280 [Planctomycetes bacterium]|nr:hypothetical protein [Planctomycetota bacterium]MDP6424594.1 VWA domain-containing protein [Planctomycetota bacterium]